MVNNSVDRAPEADDGGSSTESEYYDEVDYGALKSHAPAEEAAVQLPALDPSAAEDARPREENSRNSDVSTTGDKRPVITSNIQAPPSEPTAHRTNKAKQPETRLPRSRHDSSSLASKERPEMVAPRSRVSPSPERTYAYSRRSAERSRSKYADAPSRQSRSKPSAPKYYEKRRPSMALCDHCDARVTLPVYATAYHRAHNFCHCCKITFGNTKRDIIHPDYALVQLRFCYPCFLKNGSSFMKKVMTMKPLTQLECAGCHQVKAMDRFHRRQRIFRPWEKRLDQKNYCSKCAPSGVAPDGNDMPKYQELKCAECFTTRLRDCFSKSAHDLGSSSHKLDQLVCDDCKSSKPKESDLLCVKCNDWLPRHKFSEGHQKVAKEQDLKIGFKFKPSYMCLDCTAKARKEREEERSRSVPFKRKHEEIDDHYDSRSSPKYHFYQDAENKRYNESEVKKPAPTVHSVSHLRQDEHHAHDREQNVHDDRSFSRSRDDSIRSFSLSRDAANSLAHDKRPSSQPRTGGSRSAHVDRRSSDDFNQPKYADHMTSRPRVDASRSVHVDRSYSCSRDDSNQPAHADHVTSRQRVVASRSVHVERSYSRPRVEASKSVHVDRNYSHPGIDESQSVHVEQAYSHQRVESSHYVHVDRPSFHPADPRQFGQVEHTDSRPKDPRLAAANRSTQSPNIESSDCGGVSAHIGLPHPPVRDPRLAYANRSFSSPRESPAIPSGPGNVGISHPPAQDYRLGYVNRSLSSPKIVSTINQSGPADEGFRHLPAQDPRLAYTARSLSAARNDSTINPSGPTNDNASQLRPKDPTLAYANRSFSIPTIGSTVNLSASTYVDPSQSRAKNPRVTRVNRSLPTPKTVSNVATTKSAQVAYSRPRAEDPRLSYVKRSFSISDFDCIEPDAMDISQSVPNDPHLAYANQSVARPTIDSNGVTNFGVSHLRPRDPRFAPVNHASPRPTVNQPVHDNRLLISKPQSQIQTNGVRQESEFSSPPGQQVPDDDVSYRRSSAYFDQLERERKHLESLRPS